MIRPGLRVIGTIVALALLARPAAAQVREWPTERTLRFAAAAVACFSSTRSKGSASFRSTCGPSVSIFWLPTDTSGCWGRKERVSSSCGKSTCPYCGR